MALYPVIIMEYGISTLNNVKWSVLYMCMSVCVCMYKCVWVCVNTCVICTCVHICVYMSVPCVYIGVYVCLLHCHPQPWPRGMIVEKTRNIKADPLTDRPFSDIVLVIGLLTFALLTLLFLLLLSFALRNVWRSKHFNSKNGYIQISHD